MTLYQFSQLHEIEQEESICDVGVFLATREEEEVIFDLYQIGSFYIEFYCRINAKNERVKLRCFTDIDELLPYLDKIDITTLV